MLLVGHQPNYLPYLGFFHKIARADRFVIVDNVQFVKRGPFGWIHRNRILTNTGPQWLTVPVLTKGKFDQEIREVRINKALPWARKHWKAIAIHYGKTPCFARYAPPFEAIYARPWESLAELNEALIRAILAAFGIDVPVARASDLAVSGKGTDYVIDLCRKAGANAYLSGVHGRDYLETGKFREAGIDLSFQEFTHPRHPQAYPGEFTPNLSALDLLFNCGPESLKILTGAAAGK